MLTTDRFIETSDNHAEWIAARRRGVTATEVAKAATPQGFREALAERLEPVEYAANDYMRFGSDNEAWISRYLKRKHGILPNRWLICAADEPLDMATPDGLSPDHTRMSEVKTGGTAPKSIPLRHRRQMAWQFRCNEYAEEIVYAFVVREERNGVYVPASLTPLTWTVTRGELAELIQEMKSVAANLRHEEKERA